MSDPFIFPPHHAPLQQRYGSDQVPEGDDRTISNLLLDQIEFADVILLNKVDLLDQLQYTTTTHGTTNGSTHGSTGTQPGSTRSGTKGHQQVNGQASKKKSKSAAAAAAAEAGHGGGVVSRLVDMLQQLNPSAQVIPCRRCGVELQEVLLTGRFDMQKVSAI
jgi:G3E family GTPase